MSNDQLPITNDQTANPPNSPHSPNPPHSPNSPTRYNVAQALEEMVHSAPYRPAVIFPAGRTTEGRAKFIQYTFEQLNRQVNIIAAGLHNYGITAGTRTLLMVRPGVDLTSVAFALLKIGAVPVIIDPGMGRKSFLQCVAETEPAAFIGIPLAHALRKLFPRAFKSVTRTVTVGRRWFWGGATLSELKAGAPDNFPTAPTTTESEGAVAFTSGSTGIPKGVVYLHGMFRAQIEFLRREVGIQPGEIDLPGLPITALFNPALGVTTVIPDYDPRKPAQLNPAYWVESIQTHGVTTSFGSPTIWKIVGKYCRQNDIKLPSLKRILMAGAPVAPGLIRDYKEHILTDGEIYTPFGATEALPVTNISGEQILDGPAKMTEMGWGVCVGWPLDGVAVRIIPISDEPVETWDDSLALPPGELGEIVVKGPMVTRQYLHRPQQTALAKIQDEGEIWHRMGDLGYFDSRGRLWVCGRKSHRVETSDDLLLPVPCEAIFNGHPAVARSALVGVGQPGQQRPVIVIELKSGQIPSGEEKETLLRELDTLRLAHPHTQDIHTILFHKSLPVDVRHNVKIQREKLAVWTAKQLG